MYKFTTIAAAALAASVCGISAAEVAHFSMDVRQGQIVEQVSGNRFSVQGHFAPENMPGAVGKALRFDGYTSWVDASLGAILPEGSQQMTVSVWTAVESYPIVLIDQNTQERTAIVTCLDETKKQGFGFYLGFDGKWEFRTYVGGWPVNIVVNTPMPTYQWNCLTAVVDGANRTVTVYNNGEKVGQGRCTGNCAFSGGKFQMGHGNLMNYTGPFLLTSFNGLIDDITVYDEALAESTIKGWKAENAADLSIPASRYAGSLLRPRFHGMPATAWTNECHGMTYSDGRYHVYFQKNADGPYMARLHWGHISSDNLFNWKEEKIALAPGASYDIKGCWSGCVFTDDQITGGRPGIIYTAVDYGYASIAGASPVNNSLVTWNKWGNNPIISGRPGGLSDDFRDPYFFRNNGNAYIIVGTSKDGVGATTLHRYDAGSKSWSNDGTIFFQGKNQAADGRFWEMPNITPMGNGKWIFTATPLQTGSGVRTMYWTGTIGNDGKFVADANFSIGKNVELNSRDGYGLLSPTIYNHDGKTIVMGIVPDKLSSDDNWNLGWAHCYSLPREWSLADNGELVQKPFSGLTGMRSGTKFERASFDLDGTLDLSPVQGREAEILGTFTIGKSPFGLRLFKNGTKACTITYNPASSSITVDFSSLDRLINDGGVYNGVYTLPMPEFLRRGTDLKLNVFVDHSILDIFVNDRWASSIRLFPTDAQALGIEAFSSNGTTAVNSLQAWTLSPDGSAGIGNVWADEEAIAEDALVDVYSTAGALVRSQVAATEAVSGLAPGIYIAGGKKYVVR